MSAADLSLKDTAAVSFHTGDVVKLRIGSRSSFRAGFTGWGLLAMYANINLPRSGTAARQALARGGWRVWFQQTDAHEADHRDETGYLGPVPFPLMGDAHVLIAHTWPHTVDADAWEFCLLATAYGPSGVAMRVPLSLGTREVKIIKR